MSDEYGIQGLSGTEIISDILAQLKKRLEGDCNLRPNDSYSRGYSAKITFAVRCFGLDEQVVDGEFELGKDQDELPDEEGEGELVVPQEEDLGEVRDRIKEATAGPQDVNEVDSPDPTDAVAVKAKRKYTRKIQQLASPGVIGGAEDFKE